MQTKQTKINALTALLFIICPIAIA